MKFLTIVIAISVFLNINSVHAQVNPNLNKAQVTNLTEANLSNYNLNLDNAPLLFQYPIAYQSNLKTAFDPSQLPEPINYGYETDQFEQPGVTIRVKSKWFGRIKFPISP
ncbi:hypothetical protein [Fulvivirga lutea]|uniref:Transporter n=1 Tax=Fulvivirga lutea TaxID=2810512 RepID=A0A974ZZA2_9BACT|nr:hypothetical protein [Fulvivirga lutea]QSE95841.1 hypothetical protein JR347_09435 [Fulvivirga lutea]